MRLVKTLPFLLGLSAALGSASAWALPTDRDQPIHIQSDDAQLDDKQGVATYKGNVIITQGSMKITGNTVTITRNATGDVDVFTAVGNLAYYEQKPAVDKPIVQAYGVTIQYFAAQNRIVLIDKAKVINDGNTSEGEKIVYDTVRQVVNAGRATGSKVTTPRPRIDMVIQPKKKSDAPQKAQ
ncbi:lipopolysaccharide transport periplasmic protein LptA [Pseudomonas coleopterorum]|jgi:lipopolysaccharide export system protein LptA|uniref:Lipopolysaccharide export system protein LptA n=1 Tax=Pseudomonas coleopterorum TaxID=1605838 RepID=A0AAJ6LXT4_9PSED|nr:MULTISPECIES: lipopolysaccharide transport periplasmic protein LptA [Pseudomonas]RZA27699.1 MAG: lipopolysaccharide transport periplasmic protein LptA [Pseudomonadota bacterium]KQQ57491.1 lipopolysaccharide transport periplasmic protein LptA [Pseudomonas sp. Leaf129]MBD8481034.1 lipopolysaccharide transport periplasmic protein LptA [Pseudomonas coleopterorum]MBD8754904.1 lipopolysaccharide transport periplasmic protein LptA [Pseudomonas coleopterorum]MBD8768100.1 lipopolysaccharide transpor